MTDRRTEARRVIGWQRFPETEWRDETVLVIRARTDAWRKELRRARSVLTSRVNELIGPGVVKKIVIE